MEEVIRWNEKKVRKLAARRDKYLDIKESLRKEDKNLIVVSRFIEHYNNRIAKFETAIGVLKTFGDIQADVKELKK